MGAGTAVMVNIIVETHSQEYNVYYSVIRQRPAAPILTGTRETLSVPPPCTTCLSSSMAQAPITLTESSARDALYKQMLQSHYCHHSGFCEDFPDEAQ